MKSKGGRKLLKRRSKSDPVYINTDDFWTTTRQHGIIVISSPWHAFPDDVLASHFFFVVFSRAQKWTRVVASGFSRRLSRPCLCKSPLFCIFLFEGMMKCRSEIARGMHRATSMHRTCADNSVILLRLCSTVEPYERNPHPQAHPEHLCRGIGRSSHQSRESARATHRATTRLFESSIHRPHVWHSS